MYWPGRAGHRVDAVGLGLVVLVGRQPVGPHDGPGRGRRLAGDRGGRLDRRRRPSCGVIAEGAQDVGVLGLVVGVPVAHLGVGRDARGPAVLDGRGCGMRGGHVGQHGACLHSEASKRFVAILRFSSMISPPVSITLTQLRSFLAVVRSGSVTAAADELVVTQPSVSAAITALSREVGTPLLERDGRGVRPDARRRRLRAVRDRRHRAAREGPPGGPRGRRRRASACCASPP